jgi:diguanylate cyclase (GGDEF)-like protein/PAS domain S-box-containing protein
VTAHAIGPALNGTDDERFWRRYIAVTLVVLGIEGVGVLCYFLLSPTGSYRPTLEIIAGFVSAVSVGCAPLASRIARHPWRSQAALGVALVSGALIATLCHLDGGFDSPLLFLLALPVANAALGLSVRAVALCTAATMVEFVTVAVADPDIRASSAIFVFLSLFLGGVIVLAFGWAISRSKLDEDRAALLAKAVHLAKTDLLTGCLNHGGFFEQLDHEIARALRHGEPLSLLVVDVDLFKAFNDAHGHAAGDEALAAVGSVMRRISRGIDVIGRIGGDEFAVILPATPSAGAQRSALRMVEALERPNNVDVTTSIGFATLERSQPTASRLFRDADSGLYLAKANGRARAASNMDLQSAASSTAGLGIERKSADASRFEESVREAQTATAEALAILDALESSDVIGVGFIDRDFRIVRLNPTLASVNGGLVANQIGRTVAEVVPGLWPVLEPAYKTVLRTGQPLLDQEVVGLTADDPGHLHVWHTNFYPVTANGVRTGICVLAVDITDRKQLESQAALMHSGSSPQVASKTRP